MTSNFTVLLLRSILSLKLCSHAVIFVSKTLPWGSECGDAWWLPLTGLSWLHSLPPYASLTSPHPSIDNVFNCEVKQQGWFLITLLSRLKTLISFSYTLVKNEGELHWVQQGEQIPGTLPFQVALSCLSFSPGFDHLWLLMGGFQLNQEPEIRKLKSLKVAVWALIPGRLYETKKI